MCGDAGFAQLIKPKAENINCTHEDTILNIINGLPFFHILLSSSLSLVDHHLSVSFDFFLLTLIYIPSFLWTLVLVPIGTLHSLLPFMFISVVFLLGKLELSLFLVASG